MMRHRRHRSLIVVIALALTLGAVATPARSADGADPYLSRLWNLNGQDVKLSETDTALGAAYGVDAVDAWKVGTGNGTVVGVIDTGVEAAHPDLTANLLPGYDFINNDTITDAGSLSDHGTHVAGTIAAVRNNGIGVAGVAPDAKILPIRAVGPNTGVSELVKAIRWGAGMSVSGATTNRYPADVLNLSVSYTAACSTDLQDAINAAVARGTAIVAAVDNQNEPLDIHTPANCDHVIRVTASDRHGNLATFLGETIDGLIASNYGTAAYPATIAAPGTDIYSTVPASADPSGYGWKEGTSMAAPHISGIIAGMRSVNPTLTVAQLTALLTDTARPFATSSGCTATRCGAGIAYAPGALAAAIPVSTALSTISLSQPVIGGTVKVASLVSATVTASPSSVFRSYQWRLNDSAIAGATASSYTLPASASGKKLTVAVTIRNGSKTKALVSAARTVAAGTLTSVRPTISGTARKGHTLTAKKGTWRPTPAFHYQWLRNGKAISKATRSTYKLTSSDRSKKISVRVTGTRTGYTTVARYSVTRKVAR